MAKKASKKLFNLIKSLSGPEKRYFKIYTKHWSEKNSKYKVLFEAIDEQKIFDDHKIQYCVYGEQKIQSRRFSELKAYLYFQILKALQDYEEKKSVSLKLKNYLLNIAVLFKRALLDEAKEQLQKAKELALASELFSVLIELTDWEYKFVESDENFTNPEKKIIAIEEERKVYLEKLNNTSAYRNLFFKIYTTLKQDVLTREETMRQRLEQVIDHPLLQSPDHAKSQTASLLYFRIYSLYFYSKRKWTAYYENNKKIIQLVENSFLKNDISEYISILSNYCHSCILLKKTDEARQVLDTLFALDAQTADDRWKIHRQYFLNNFSMLIESGNFEEGLQLIRKHEIEKQVFEPEKFQADVFYFAYFYIYFGVDDYNNSFTILQEWMDIPPGNARTDLQSLARVLDLIVHYERRDHLYFETLQRKTHRFLKRNKWFHNFEKILLRNLRKAYHLPEKSAEKALFKKLREKLIASANEESFTIILGMFDFMSWIDSKIGGRSFGDIIRAKNKPHKPDQ